MPARRLGRQRSVRYALSDVGLKLFFDGKDVLVFDYDSSGASLPGFEIETSTPAAVEFFARTDSIDESRSSVADNVARIRGDAGFTLLVRRPPQAERSFLWVNYALGVANPRLCDFFGHAQNLGFRYNATAARMELDREFAYGLEIADSLRDAIGFFQSTVAVDDTMSYVTTDGLGAVLMGNSGRTLRIRHMESEPDWRDGDEGLVAYRNSKTYDWRTENEDLAAFFNCPQQVRFLYDKRAHGDSNPAIRVYEDGDCRWPLVLASHVSSAHDFFQNNDAIDFVKSRVEDGFTAVLVGASDGFEISITDTLRRAAAPSAEMPD